jgi:hypothetical protein
MSRSIPPVRAWRVRFYDGATILADVVVDTINKRFARWLANERAGYPAPRSTRISVSLVKEG